MYDAIAIGELLIDFTCRSQDAQGYPTMEAHPGGAPANFLAAINRFGGKTALLGKVGSDAFGHLLRGTLEQAGIDNTGVLVDPAVFTTLAFVTLDSHGDREFSFARKPGADTMIRKEELNLDLLDQARLLHFGSLSLTDEPARSATQFAVAYARERGKLVSFDPNLRRPLWRDLDEAREQMLWGLGQADMVKISEEEVVFLFGMQDAKEGAKHIREQYGVKLVFVTLGPDGCWFDNGQACGHVPSLAGIQVKDTTGAGDIFGGSAVWQVLQTGKNPADLRQDELTKAVTFACTAAGLSTTKPGGISSVPSLEEVEARING